MRELEPLKEDALAKQLVEMRKELMKINAQVASGTVPKSPGTIRKIKRQIARILTLNNQRRKTPK
ncbi:MAG: 50S ribosomal protein L29 [Candidatus Woesearchaeota archaeon]